MEMHVVSSANGFGVDDELRGRLDVGVWIVLAMAVRGAAERISPRPVGFSSDLGLLLALELALVLAAGFLRCCSFKFCSMRSFALRGSAASDFVGKCHCVCLASG